MHYDSVTVLVFMVWLIGCSGGAHPPQSGDESLHDETIVRTTLFSEHIEFYLEYPVPEEGEEAEILVHVTSLPTYKPFLSGSLSVMGEGLSSTSESPVRPGIFVLQLHPDRPGELQALITYHSDTLTESVRTMFHTVAGHGTHPAEEAEEYGEAPAASAEGEIRLLKEQAWENDFMVIPARPVDFSTVIPASGEILSMPGEKKSMSAPNRGMVHFAGRNKVQGSPVREGEQLFTINTDRMIDNNVMLQIQEAENRFEKSRSEFERHRRLYAGGAISERQLINSRTEYIEDSLRYFSLESRASSGGFRVFAPVTGTIHELYVSEGTYVETGQTLATISTNRSLLIRADLPQQYFDRLGTIVSAHFRPAYSDRVFTLENMNGRLLARGASVAENDHYLPVIFELENDGRLLEGAYTEVFLITEAKREALVVPLTALSEEQGKYWLYLQVNGESYTKRAVTPGGNDGLDVEILDGLKAGERVVTKGVPLLKAASVVTGTVSHGHSH